MYYSLNAHDLNSWAKAIEKVDSTVTELKLPQLIIEVLRAT